MNTPENLKYSETHEWTRKGEGDVVTVGISDFAQDQLGDVVFVELPNEGQDRQGGRRGGGGGVGQDGLGHLCARVGRDYRSQR